MEETSTAWTEAIPSGQEETKTSFGYSSSDDSYDSGGSSSSGGNGSSGGSQTTTEAPTEAPTEPSTEPPTEPSTAEPTEPSTAEPTEPSTAEPTEPSTAEPEEYTVTFMYNGTEFGTQQVKKGQCAAEPWLRPANVGSWDYNFEKPVTGDLTIQWKSGG